jgi:phosphoglucosamine mutase
MALYPPARLLVGRATRESGEWKAGELGRGAARHGAHVVSAGVMPTPAIAYLAGAYDFVLGVVLSASHNPFGDNGIKVFSGRGEKFGDANERRVEALIERIGAAAGSAGPAGLDAAIERVDLREPYLDYTRRLLPDAGALSGARLAIDLANGATTATARTMFERLGFDVRAIGDAPDGRNINLACGSTHPAGLSALVVSAQCRLGVAFDGDGDRAIFIDAAGRVVDGDAVLLLLATHFQRQGRLPGDTVVATVMSNIGLEIALRQRGITLVRTPVGDKYVMESMLQHGYALGGEQSGHVILAEHLPTGDGMATALAVLRVMADTGRELSDLAGELVTYPQTLVNVRVRRKAPVEDVPVIRDAIARVEAALDGRGRVLVRYSGTAPLLRVMIEGQSQASVQAMAEEIADAVRESIGAGG